MKPAPFEYAAPSTIDEAIALLSANPLDDVKILAGGQSLMPMIHMRLARPDLLVDLGRVEGLSYIREAEVAGRPGGVEIGAMTTKTEVEESAWLRERWPLFHAATVLIGHPQIRNRGTVGGSMAQADAAAEYPAVALVLDIEMVAQGPAGERVIAADDFFVTFLTTALEENEILTQVRIPAMPPGTGGSFQELARRHGDFALVGAALSLRLEQGVCRDTRIAIFGVSDRARRMTAAEAVVDGQAPAADVFARAGAEVASAVEDPRSDVHGSAEYRRQLANVLTVRGLKEAAERAAAEG